MNRQMSNELVEKTKLVQDLETKMKTDTNFYTTQIKSMTKDLKQIKQKYEEVEKEKLKMEQEIEVQKSKK